MPRIEGVECPPPGGDAPTRTERRGRRLMIEQDFGLRAVRRASAFAALRRGGS